MAIYTDLDLDLTLKQNGDITSFEEIDAVISSLKNILNTMQGSRRMLPTFAQRIYSLLFEPVDRTTAHNIAENFLQGITIWDSRIKVTNITIRPDEENNRYDISLTFYIKEIQYEHTITHILFAVV